ncbi:actin filament organization protein-like protein App1-like protein [Trichodelitschia bisporula]|uniref:Actin filament organization protein-like protein App1-like protein n=1 Tax=Trichodelitschia bisporula TaxID=703511 RepID=A0A6G1HYF9_9PEZI|nr:actin filament organization protein-like protein App1-like protein [Trichodelitschia bisporula]
METAYRRTKQLAEETDDERHFRKQADFPKIESKMKGIGTRRHASVIDTIGSYLGAKNPFTHPANPKSHNVWLFDNTAWQSASGEWQMHVVAAYFVKNSGKDESRSVADISALLGLAENAEARDTLRRRLQPLMDTVLPAHTITLSVTDSTHRLGPSDRDGISTNLIQIAGDYTDGSTLKSTAVDFGSSATPLCTTFAKSTGWAVISDIDDTIKKTLTVSPLGILRTTFVDEPEPIAGMPELYAHMQIALESPPFWYLSASPYNLYPFLRSFRDEYYPPGTMILREASWMNLSGFLTSLSQGTQAYKVSRMREIQSRFPGRRFVCLGDSTQSDPEAYGEMYRAFPGWVAAIYIRRVAGVAEIDESQKNSPGRFEKAFKDIPATVWHVFDDPAEVKAKIDELVAESPEITAETEEGPAVKASAE